MILMHQKSRLTTLTGMCSLQDTHETNYFKDPNCATDPKIHFKYLFAALGVLIIQDLEKIFSYPNLFLTAAQSKTSCIVASYQ